MLDIDVPPLSGGRSRVEGREREAEKRSLKKLQRSQRGVMNKRKLKQLVQRGVG